jgi:hypothetical protein
VMRALQPPSVFVGVTKPHHQRPYWQHCCSAQPSSSVWLQWTPLSVVLVCPARPCTLSGTNYC